MKVQLWPFIGLMNVVELSWRFGCGACRGSLGLRRCGVELVLLKHNQGALDNLCWLLDAKIKQYNSKVGEAK